MRLLVTAATRHDSTYDIAERIAKDLRERGIDADVRPPDSVETLEGYEAVVVGSAVYYGKWLPAAFSFIERHRLELGHRAVWLFSSGPLGSPDPKPEGDPAGIAELVASLAARGHRVFAGSLDRSRIGLGERVIVGVVRAPEGDYRDWDTIDLWAAEIARQLTSEVAGPA